MFISVRYWDDVPKGTAYNFDHVDSFSCVVDDHVNFEGEDLEVYKIIFTDHNGTHEVKRVMDFEVI